LAELRPWFPVEQSHPDNIGGRAMSSYIDWIAPTFVLTLVSVPPDLEELARQQGILQGREAWTTFFDSIDTHRRHRQKDRAMHDAKQKSSMFPLGPSLIKSVEK